MATITLDWDDLMNRKIVKLPGVRAVVKAAAEDIESEASSNLAPHRKSGNAHITLHRERGDRYGRIDWFVSLNDPGGNAMAIEFGHENSGKYEHVEGRAEGLYVLTDAMDAAVRTHLT